jgi:hypothetical protein
VGTLSNPVLLEQGALCYRAIDFAPLAKRTRNCIHVISELAHEQRGLRVSIFAWGEKAAYCIVRHLHGWLIHPERTHDWLAHRLGLTHYPIVPRAVDENPFPFLR